MESVGKYKVLSEIGTSAAGTAYRALDTFRNRELVLKVLSFSAITDPEVKNYLRREFGACSELRHTHIAAIYEAGEAGDEVYIATELLTGEDLRQHIDGHGAMTLVQKLELVAQVCDALAVAHPKGIVHGDIKPSNIFLVDGKDAKVLDFGIGRWLAAILKSGNPPARFQPHYLSPEQVLGYPLCAKSDVFSLGVVLYEMLAGKHPFPVAASLVPREIVHAEPEPLCKLNPEVPAELGALVVRALHKTPEQRFETVDEFGAGLRAIVAQLTAPAQPETPAVAPEPVPPVVTPAPPAVPTSFASVVQKPSHGGKRVFVYGVAAILALIIFIVLLSRPKTSAHPVQRAAPVSQAKPALSIKTEPPAAKLAPAPAPQQAPRPIQFDEVRSLWQSGKYAQAMELVDSILVASPTSSEARAWKKKIRAAQDAEAAMK